MKMKIGYVLFICLCFCFQVISQSPVELAAREELERRGLDENRVRTEMLNRGINLDNVDANNPAEVARVEEALREVIQILEAEKLNEQRNNANTETDSPNVADVIEPPVDTIPDTTSVEIADPQLTSLLPQPVKIYGQHVFRNKTIDLYEIAEDAKPPQSYVLGPGDQIVVSIWGLSEENFSIEIESDGYIKPLKMPRIYVSGLSLKQAKQLLRTKFSQYYLFRSEEFELSVNTSRNINVNIVGEVINSGSFNILAINTAFNALVAAGGPSDIGSVRKIQILRSGEDPKTMDVYRFLLNPMEAEDFYLQENDYIYVPVADKVVTITGAVNRSYRYELLENENLVSLIRLAGGLKADALKKNIQVTRIENDARTVIDIDLNELERTQGDFRLLNGDVVSILAIPTAVKNYAVLKGGVESPGRYAIGNNTRLTELLSKTVVKENAITSVAYLQRLNNDLNTTRYIYVNLGQAIANPGSQADLILEPGDQITIYEGSFFTDKNSFSVEGAVRSPGQFDLDLSGQLRVSDAIFMSGGIKEEALDFAYIFRRNNENSKSVDYVDVDLKAALDNPSSSANILLLPGDKLIVYSREDYTDQSFVSIGGAVREPGEFIYDTSLKLRDVILLAGGLKLEAANNKIDIYRVDFESGNKTAFIAATVSVDENYDETGGTSFDLQPFDQIYVRTAPEFELLKNVSITGEVAYPGPYALIDDNTKLSTVIGEAGGLTSEAFEGGATLFRPKDDIGYVIIDLKKAMENPSSFNNIILQDGDEIFIPKQQNLISLIGETKASELYPDEIARQPSLNFPYEQNKNAMYYINKYGAGVGKDGSKSKISVTYPNGEVKHAKRFLFFYRYPEVVEGSVIKVGAKDEEIFAEAEKKDIDWGSVLSDAVAQATAILTLVLLLDRVN